MVKVVAWTLVATERRINLMRVAFKGAFLRTPKIWEFLEKSAILVTSEPATLEREFSAFSGLKDNYDHTLLPMDPFDTDENDVKKKNLVNWLSDDDTRMFASHQKLTLNHN